MSKISVGAFGVAGMIALAVPMSAHAGGGGASRSGFVTEALIGVPVGGPSYGAAYTPLAGYEPFSYAAPFPVACPGGYWAHRPLVDRWGNVFGYSLPRFFCP